ncbi:MAG: hypothetical protein ACLGI2_01660 [Acidimicrobiia bacterium]
MVTAAVLALAFVAAWTAWCVAVTRRSGPGAAALTAVPPIVLVLLAVQAGSGLSLVSFWGDQASAAEVRRAVAASGAAGLAATVGILALAAWVNHSDGDDARSRSVLTGIGVAVAVWSGACSALLGA